MLDMLTRGGPLMIPLYFCSVAALALIIWKSAELAVALRELEGAPDALLRRRPPLLRPMLDALDQGAGEQEIAFTGSRQVRHLERGIGSLGLIATVSPLLGLTGTVTGMINAFQSIAAAGSRADVTVVASGIWEALLTTAVGLLIAIPAHVACHYLERRMERITLILEETGTVLYERRESPCA